MKKIVLLVAAMTAVSAWAQSTAERVQVKDAFVRLAPPGTMVTAAFMVLQNSGEKEAQLLKVESAAAENTELHNHINDGGVMKMRPVSAVPLKAKAETALKPGGYHIMLINLKATLIEGEDVTIKLGFDDGSSKSVAAKVVKSMPPHGGHQHHKH